VLVFVPDWRVCGQRLAQDTSRPGVPNTVMSRPIVRHEVAHCE